MPDIIPPDPATIAGAVGTAAGFVVSVKGFIATLADSLKALDDVKQIPQMREAVAGMQATLQEMARTVERAEQDFEHDFERLEQKFDHELRYLQAQVESVAKLYDVQVLDLRGEVARMSLEMERLTAEFNALREQMLLHRPPLRGLSPHE